jgi:hypothetical protein
VNKTTASLHQAAVIGSPWRFLLFTSALAGITSSRTSVPEKAPWRLHRSVAVFARWRTAPDVDLLIFILFEKVNPAKDGKVGKCSEPCI